MGFDGLHDRTRPSEVAGLLVSDINIESREISITKSRYLDADARPKTGRSERTIRVPQSLIDALRTVNSFELGTECLFLNKSGGALDGNQ